MSRLRIALFGAGRIGGVHGRNIARHAQADLVAVVDPVASAGRDALTVETGAQLVEAEAVFADPSIDGVVVASSTDSHADLLLRAARAGKPVFCEKPVSLDFALIEKVVDVVEAEGIPCMMGFQRRYDAAFRTLRDRIESGVAGRLEHLVSTSRDPSPPPRSYVETSGGMVRDTAIHDLDMARFLLNEDVTSVYAAGSCLISEEIGAAGDIDTLMITLTTRSGRLAQVVNCRRGPMGYDQRIEALCAREVLRVENVAQTTLRIEDGQGARSDPPMNYFIDRFAQAYRDEMDDFVAMIREGRTPLATIRDGLEAQRLAEAAIVSLESGQAVAFNEEWRP